MKENIKLFEDLQSAKGYEIEDIPFITTIKRDGVGLPSQNLHCDEEGKYIKVSNNTARITDIVLAVVFETSNKNCSIGLEKRGTNQTVLEYSYNRKNWTDFNTGTTIPVGVTVSGVNLDRVYVRGKLTGDNSISNYTQFRIDGGGFKISGKINHLWNYDDLSQPLKKYCGYELFMGCSGIIDASELELPTNTLADYCYQGMFSNCSSLTTAPELPTTTLTTACYRGMFADCTSLATAPTLPATELANNCYQGMFSGCTSLTTAPELPATTLANYCYYNMFYGCSGLTIAPELPATTLASNCYSDMFNGCTSLSDAPELPATTLASFCYHSMFYGCTSLTTAPELPATTLASYCYNVMFAGCTSLTTAPELPATTLANSCYLGMFQGCSSLNYIKCLATDISASNCTTNFVNGVASSGTFVKAANMTDWATGNSGIPVNWTVVDNQ